MNKNILIKNQINLIYLCLPALMILMFVSCNGFNIYPNLETPVVRLSLSDDSPSTKVIISWNNCEDAEGYAIEKTFMKDGVLEEIHFNYLPKDKNYYVDSDCEPGVEYTYTVGVGYFKTMGFFYGRVFGKTDERYSSPVSIKTARDPLVSLDFPKNVEISSVEGNTNALKIKWAACEGADSYEIYCKCLWEDNTGNYSYVCKVNEPECTMLHLYNEVEYVYKIKALGVNGTKSILSAPKAGTVPKAENTKIDLAIEIQNNTTEKYKSSEESLWFIIAPEKGTITISEAINANAMLFTLDGKLLNGCIAFEQKDRNFVYSLKDENTDFVSGSKYLLRIVNPFAMTLRIE